MNPLFEQIISCEIGVSTALTIKISVFRDVMPYTLVDLY
jgi:hypothetical protein